MLKHTRLPRSVDNLKVLGFHIDSRPSCHTHLEALRIRIRDVSWVLWYLKHVGFNQYKLAEIYWTVVRPVLNYCAVVYHPLMNDKQDYMVERMQARDLKSIYGYCQIHRTDKELRDK